MTMEVTLRDVIDDDLPIFFEQQNDPIANEMAAFPARDREAFMAHWAKNLLNEKALHKGLREVGYWLGREYWGKGIANRALAEFLKHENTRPLHGVTVKHNIGSQHVLKKCGFEFEHEEKDELFFVLK